MWLSDFTLVLPDRLVEHGSVRIAGGLIAEIAEHPVETGTERTVNGQGRHLFPGFIDMHGDMIEVELEPRPRVEFPMELAMSMLDARLAASGVTTAYASVSFSRGASHGERRSYEHTAGVIRGVAKARTGLRVDHRIHARFDITFTAAVDVINELIADGTADLVSLMDHTPGQGQYRDLERLIRIIAKEDGITEDAARARIMGRIADQSLPAEQTLATMKAVSAVCAKHNIPIASHDDDTVEKTRLMADLGAVISEFPVTIEAAETARETGMVVAMGAPNALRGMSYSGNLSARQTHGAGLLGILAADYHPGAILPAVRILAETDPGGLPGAARLAAQNPARALGLTDRGAIAEGLCADLVAADPGRFGRPVATWRAGALIYTDGTLGGL